MSQAVKAVAPDRELPRDRRRNRVRGGFHRQSGKEAGVEGRDHRRAGGQPRRADLDCFQSRPVVQGRKPCRRLDASQDAPIDDSGVGEVRPAMDNPVPASALALPGAFCTANIT